MRFSNLKLLSSFVNARRPVSSLFSLICCSIFLSSSLLLPASAALAQANPLTILNCGSPAATDTYTANSSAEDSALVAGPMECEQARNIASSLNAAGGCCLQGFATTIQELAERRARSLCNEKAGENFACDIFISDDTVCTAGCGMTVKPADNSMGCVNQGPPACQGTATSVKTDQTGICTVQCSVEVQSTAFGAFKVGCSGCTNEANCAGLAQEQIQKEAELAALKAEKEAIEAKIAALDPADPNYAAIAAELAVDLFAIISKINTISSFLTNLKKLFGAGKKCAGK